MKQVKLKKTQKNQKKIPLKAGTKKKQERD
jgi:hypothetical protein